MAFMLGTQPIGAGQPPCLIAELSANHGGSLEQAQDLLRQVAQAGAQVIKIQSYTADAITLNSRAEAFMLRDGLWAGRSLYELYQQAATPLSWIAPLFELARELGVTLFSSPFDDAAVEALEQSDCPAYKIASLELLHVPLLRCVAATGKPLVLSSGTATLGEIEQALNCLAQAGAGPVMLLHCVSKYPTRPHEAQLQRITQLREAFGLPTGFSDHSEGSAIALAAVAMGACAVEKHVCLDRQDGTVDAAFSLDMQELPILLQDMQTIHAAAQPIENLRQRSDQSETRYRRSIYVARNIRAGEVLNADNLRVVRPNGGLSPLHWDRVTQGATARHDLEAGTALSFSHIDFQF